MQRNIRPCVIVQNDFGNMFSRSVIILPLTTKNKKSLPTHCKIPSDAETGLLFESTALAEQLITVSVDQLGSKIGTIRNRVDVISKINKCITISLNMQVSVAV